MRRHRSTRIDTSGSDAVVGDAGERTCEKIGELPLRTHMLRYCTYTSRGHLLSREKSRTLRLREQRARSMQPITHRPGGHEPLPCPTGFVRLIAPGAARLLEPFSIHTGRPECVPEAERAVFTRGAEQPLSPPPRLLLPPPRPPPALPASPLPLTVAEERRQLSEQPVVCKNVTCVEAQLMAASWNGSAPLVIDIALGHKIHLAEQLNITSAMDVTLRAKPSDPPHVTVINAAPSSRAFEVWGRLTLVNVKVSCDRRGSKHSVIDRGGGALLRSLAMHSDNRSQGGTLLLNNSRFEKCEAVYGGGIYVEAGRVELLDDSSVYECEALEGGGIYLEAGSVELRDSAVENCSAVDNGWQSAAVEVSRSSIRRGPRGGGVYVNSGELLMSASSISNCTSQVKSGASEAHAGGLYVGAWANRGIGHDGPANVMILNDSSIKGCVANSDVGPARGGGILMRGGNVTVRAREQPPARALCHRPAVAVAAPLARPLSSPLTPNLRPPPLTWCPHAGVLRSTAALSPSAALRPRAGWLKAGASCW